MYWVAKSDSRKRKPVRIGSQGRTRPQTGYYQILATSFHVTSERINELNKIGPNFDEWVYYFLFFALIKITQYKH